MLSCQNGMGLGFYGQAIHRNNLIALLSMREPFFYVATPTLLSSIIEIKDWSWITGMGAYNMGTLWVRSLSRSTSKKDKNLFRTPF